MAIHASSTPAPAVHPGLLRSVSAAPLPDDFSLAAAIRRADACVADQAQRSARMPPVDDPRSPEELLEEIRRTIEGQTPELPPEPLLPAADLARARHMRRELEQAARHGTALLAALGLPRLVDADFIQVDGDALGDALEVVVAHLDAIDPDPDLEPEDELLEPGGDDELDLGWSALHSQVNLGWNWADGDATALEIHGKGFRRSGHEDAEDDDPGGSDDNGDHGIADADGLSEQWQGTFTGALPWSVGGYVA